MTDYTTSIMVSIDILQIIDTNATTPERLPGSLSLLEYDKKLSILAGAP